MSDDDRLALYLATLQEELRNVDGRVRDGVVGDVARRIRDERADGRSLDEILEETGDPRDIAADVRERHGVRERGVWREIAAIILLLFGGVIIPIAGWFVGLYFLWSSPVWTVRMKIAATLLWPFGALGPLLLAGSDPIYALLLVVPAGTTLFLSLRLRRAQLPQ
jgi:uncharacterized membrane protein